MTSWLGSLVRCHPRACLLAHALTLAASSTLLAQDVLTWKNDNQRTGQNLSETVLTPTSVSSPSFGKLFSVGVDAAVFAQPLYKRNVAISGKGTHNAVFVATSNNSVYAFDADNGNGLWQDNFGTPTGTPPYQYGVTGTPVIDPSSDTLYCVSTTSESSTLVHRLHALDIGSGGEKFGGPVVVMASVPGSGSGSSGGTLPFSACAPNQLARPAVTLSNGVVYIAWGGPGDVTPWHGWVISYNASTLAQLVVYNTTPNGDGGGVWMAGALSSDLAGSLFATSGNGDFDPSLGGQHGNSVIKLSGSLSVLDYFSPSSSASDNSHDLDLGAGGCLILPDQSGPFPHLLIQGGKPGVLRVLNRDNLGGYNAGGNQVVQELTIPNSGMLFSTPSYFNDGSNLWVYVKDIGPNYGSSPNPMFQYKLTNGTLSSGPVHQSSPQWGPRCGSPSVSANGTSGGVVWGIEPSNPAVLHAFDAANLGASLYSSSTNANDMLGPGVSFTNPTVANGKVYVGTATGLYCYGLPPTNPTPPTITTQPANQTVTAGQTATFTLAATGTAPLSYQWQKSGANIPGANGPSYTTPATTLADSGSTFRCIVTNSAGSATSSSATLTVHSTPVGPTITTQPSNQSVLVGQTATFTVQATGTAPLSYQWQKNGTNIAGATRTSYTTPAATTADNGSTYQCVVTNSAGSVTSHSATLTVTVAAPVIVTQPTNQAVTLGNMATFSVVASGTAPLSYQWQKSGTNIAGATSSSYTTPATTAVDNGATYRVIVRNSAGAVTSDPATLTVNLPPTIVTQPGNQIAALGQPASFSVEVTGSAPLSYQWQKNGSNIPGATGSSYTTPAVTQADKGSTYQVVVTNMAGTVTSESAEILFGTAMSAKGACGLMGLEGLALALLARGARRLRRT